MKTTEQQFFDKSARHLLKQRRRSTSATEEDYCLYRGPNGLMCAVGVCIPDELYIKAMEGCSVSNLLKRYPLLHNYIPNVELAEELQQLHDSVSPERWGDELWSIACVHGLEWNP